MKKTITLILTFILIISTLESQNIKRFELNIMPLSIIDYTQPLIRFGFKTLITDKISLSSDLGYGFNFLTTIYNEDNKNSGYKVYSFRPEVDYFIYKKSSMNIYGGLEYLFLRRTEISKNFIIATPDNTFIRIKEADYLKIKQALNLKLGIVFYLKNSFSLDTYFGAGYRFRYVAVSNIKGGEIILPYPDYFFPCNIGMRKGLNLTAGLKIGYRF